MLTSVIRRGGGDAGASHAVGGGRRRDPLAVGSFEDLEQRVADRLQPFGHRRVVPPQCLVAAEVDHAARVDHEVGREEDAGVAEALAVLRDAELVVRGAGDDPAPEDAGSSPPSPPCPWHMARTRHIPYSSRRRRRPPWHPARPRGSLHARHPGRRARAWHPPRGDARPACSRPSRDPARAPTARRGRLIRTRACTVASIPWNTPRAVAAPGIARPAVRLRAPEDVRRSLADRVHVRLARVHVGGRHVGPVQRLDQVRVARRRSARRSEVPRAGTSGTARTALPPP